MSGLTHLDTQGRAHMVDVSAKPPLKRTAVARGRIVLAPDVLERGRGLVGLGGGGQGAQGEGRQQVRAACRERAVDPEQPADIGPAVFHLRETSGQHLSSTAENTPTRSVSATSQGSEAEPVSRMRPAISSLETASSSKVMIVLAT